MGFPWGPGRPGGGNGNGNNGNGNGNGGSGGAGGNISGTVFEDNDGGTGFLTVSGDAATSVPGNGNGNGGGNQNDWFNVDYAGAYGTLDMDADGTWTYTADNSQAAIQDLNTGDTLFEVFTVTQATGPAAMITIAIEGLDEPPCFVVGTMIRTPRGPRPIETLKIGDLVLTQDAGPQEIRWIGSKKVSPASTVDYDAIRPIRILKDCFGPGVPSHDLLVSPMHRILLKGAQPLLLFGQEQVLCAAKLLVNGQTIVKDPAPSVEYFHILFDRHEVIEANSCPTESFLPGTVGLSNFDISAQEQVFELFPELRSLPDSYGPAARRILRRYEADLLGREYGPENTFLDRLVDVA